MNKISNELLEYSKKTSPSCDTTKPTCKASISFGNNQSAKSFEYCVNGTFNDLPAPIKLYNGRHWYYGAMASNSKKIIEG
jgi:hypothetical protein